MEMKELDAEKERSKENEGASEPMLEVKTEALEEAEPDAYCLLQNPPEDIYSEACFGDSPVKTKEGKQTGGNVHLYRALCLFLTVICLILMLVVIVLSLKFQTGSKVCPEREETTAVYQETPSFAKPCDYEQCQAHFPYLQPHHIGCQQCADGWLTFGQSCFYLSTFRLSWDQSQRNCTSRGGSLAVITSQSVQNFLSKEGNLKYWIGLRRKAIRWTWVNNTVLQESYWADQSAGDCGILDSESAPEKNWIRASCEAHTYFICQLHL